VYITPLYAFMSWALTNLPFTGNIERMMTMMMMMIIIIILIIMVVVVVVI
jgi:hypothetical protein